MDKYYTPDISEFHAGFEFEEESISGLMYHNKIFRFDWFDLQKEIITGIDNKKIRVKILDKDDIESLGWKHIGGKLLSSAEQIFSKGVYNLYYTQNSKLKITNDNENWSHEVEGGIKFEGYIKNKSELVKLLKQLGIE